MSDGPGTVRPVPLDTVDDAIEAPYRHATEALSPQGPPPKRANPLRQFWVDLSSVRLLRRTPYGMTPVLVFGLTSFFQRFDSFAVSAALPEIVRGLGIDLASIIDMLSLVGAIGLFTSIVVGYFGDRVRRVPLYALGNLVSGIFASLTGFGRRTLTFGTARVLDDAAGEVASVPSGSLLADYYPPEARGRAFAFLGTVANLGTIVSTIVVAVMVDRLGVSTAFKLFGIPIIVMGIVALLTLREPVRGYFERKALGASEEVARTEDEPQSFGEAWRSTFAVRTLRRFFVGEIIGSVPAFVGVILISFFAEVYGLTIIQRSFVLLPTVVAGLVGGVYGGGLVDRFTTRRPGRVVVVFGVFTAIGSLTYGLLVFRPPIALLVVFLAVQSFFASLNGPALRVVYSQVIPPAIRTQGLQITGLATLSGIVVGPQIISMLFGADANYTAVFLFTMPFGVVAGLIYASAGAYFDVDRKNSFAQAIAAEDWRRAKEAGSTRLLVCRDVDVAYDGVQVLFNVTLDIDEGEIVALLGTNGAGKSTLLRAVSGTQEASGGAILFDGRDITHMPPHEIAARGVVQMPGGRGIFPGLTVRENLLLGGWLADDVGAAEQRRRLAEVLGVFPRLAERIDEPAGLLSGGEQQQLSLAQAFLMRPKLLLIDELSLGLSPAVVGELLEVVREIHRRGVTVVVVEQSVNVALELATRAVFMEKGEVKFDGSTAELMGRPDILRAVYVKGTGGAAVTAGRSAAPAGGGSRPVVLEAVDVHKRYGGVVALDGVGVALHDGEVLGLIGPNGSGKTTLFDVLSGFVPPDAGSVLLDGRDVTGLDPDERSRLGLVRRFQDARLFPSLTVHETILVALEQRLEVRSATLAAVAAPRARRAERRLRARADALVELMGLGSYRDKFVKELSTGLRRIVDLACVMAAEPRVLLLDEPSSGIAQAEAEGLAPLLRRVRFETGCSILIIEHDMPLISAVSDELVALDRGAVLLRGGPEEVLDDERVVTAYLGGSEAAVNRSGRRA